MFGPKDIIVKDFNSDVIKFINIVNLSCPKILYLYVLNLK